ncbi:MAG: zinc/iron-chelating domain-containing protein [Desulfovibrionaceae bacterium]|nr:zinc/iron-chelating domain-containing protein [Desulfovibrionaceae bacterium]
MICKRCAAQGPTCCHLDPGHAEFCFPLSVFEKERLQDFQPNAGGFALQANTRAFLDGMGRLFPGESAALLEIFPLGKEHFRLAVDAGGRCRFLGQDGCLVPEEFRPYYCRIYPFWILGVRITFFDSPTCLARKQGGRLAEMIRLLGASEAQIRDLHGRLRLAWGLAPRPDMAAVKRGF